MVSTCSVYLNIRDGMLPIFYTSQNFRSSILAIGHILSCGAKSYFQDSISVINRFRRSERICVDYSKSSRSNKIHQHDQKAFPNYPALDMRSRMRDRALYWRAIPFGQMGWGGAQQKKADCMLEPLANVPWNRSAFGNNPLWRSSPRIRGHIL